MVELECRGNNGGTLKKAARILSNHREHSLLLKFRNVREGHTLLLWGNSGAPCRNNDGGILKKAAQILSKAQD